MILVTGASGFVGRNLIPRLIKKKYEICCILRNSNNKEFINYLKRHNIKIVFSSLSDYNSLDKTLKTLKISNIIHLAGLIKSNKYKDFFDVNVKSTENLVKICKKKKVSSFIFISTDLAAKKKLTIYGKSKHEAEQLIKKSGINYVILRPTVIYGKGDSKFVMDLVKIIKKSGIIPVIGTGEYIFQPVFVNDIANIIIKCLDLKNKKTYNVCCDESLTLNQIIDIIADALNKKIVKFYVPIVILKPIVKLYEQIFPNPSLTTQQLRYFPLREKLDNSRVRKDLNFKFTSFREGIKRSI